MNNLMKNIIFGVVVVFLIIIVGYYLVGSQFQNVVTSPQCQFGYHFNSSSKKCQSICTAGYAYFSVVKNGITSVGCSLNSTTSTSTMKTTTIGSIYTLILENNASLGTYLANQSGFTLYYYKYDVRNSGISYCSSSCSQTGSFPAFYTPTLILPSGLNASSFNTITRSDGTKQLVYNGLPLYLSRQNIQAGQTANMSSAGFIIANTEYN